MASRRPKIVVLNHVLNHCAIGRVWPDGIEYTRFKHTNGMEASLGTGISYPSALAEAAQGSKTLNVLPQPQPDIPICRLYINAALVPGSVWAIPV